MLHVRRISRPPSVCADLGYMSQCRIDSSPLVRKWENEYGIQRFTVVSGWRKSHSIEPGQLAIPPKPPKLMVLTVCQSRSRRGAEKIKWPIGFVRRQGIGKKGTPSLLQVLHKKSHNWN